MNEDSIFPSGIHAHAKIPKRLKDLSAVTVSPFAICGGRGFRLGCSKSRITSSHP